jgi:hypothetical protein
MSGDMHPAIRPQVKITATAAEYCVAFEGLMREPHPDTWFLPLINEAHGHAVNDRLREVVLDIRQLSYANAAAWKCLVYWLKRMHQDSRAGYRLRILCEQAHSWQHVGMPALRVFGGERLVIEVYAGAQKLS